mgnify:CR=1 FL=1
MHKPDCGNGRKIKDERMHRNHQKEERLKINFKGSPLATVLNNLKQLIEESDLHELDKDLYVENLFLIAKVLDKETDAVVSVSTFDSVTTDKYPMCVCPVCMSVQCSYDDLKNHKHNNNDYCWNCGQKLNWENIVEKAKKDWPKEEKGLKTEGQTLYNGPDTLNTVTIRESSQLPKDLDNFFSDRWYLKYGDDGKYPKTSL